MYVTLRVYRCQSACSLCGISSVTQQLKVFLSGQYFELAKEEIYVFAYGTCLCNITIPPLFLLDARDPAAIAENTRRREGYQQQVLQWLKSSAHAYNGVDGGVAPWVVPRPAIPGARTSYQFEPAINSGLGYKR
jgi:hypothetical protein